MDETVFYNMSCEWVEKFLAAIGGTVGLTLNNLFILREKYQDPEFFETIGDIAAALRAETAGVEINWDIQKYLIDGVFINTEIVSPKNGVTLQEMWDSRQPYCLIMEFQTAGKITWDEETEMDGIWERITGFIGDAIDGVKDFIKNNLAIVIIVILLSLTAIFAPMMLFSIGKTIYSILKGIGIATAKTLTTINGWITTVKGWLHIQEIGAIMETVGSISRLLERISPTWAKTIQGWENEIAKASKSLFGDSNTISAYLIALQMTVMDISSLAGKPYDMFQLDFYREATAVTQRIADRQETYQNNPGALWYDMQEWFLQPYYNEGVEHRRATDKLIGQLGLTAETITGNLEVVDSRLAEYEKVLTPTGLEELKQTLGETRRALREDAIEPLNDFKRDVTDIYIGKFPDKSFSQRWNMLIQPALDNANILGADENTLTTYQKEQRLSKGENLLDFVSRIARSAWDGVIGGVHRAYTETIGMLDRDELVIPPVLEYTPTEWKMTPSLLAPAKPFTHSPSPPSIAIPRTAARERILSALDLGIQSIEEKLK